jgi:hypothetical protein
MIDQLHSSDVGEKSVSVPELLIDYEKAYDSLRREMLYSIFIEFCMPVEPVRPITVCLNGKVKICLMHFPFRMVLTRRRFIVIAFSTLL